MTMISDLSVDLVEEIFSRVPLTSLREVRSTCKQWNALCKDNSFRKKHCGKAAKEFLLDMTYAYAFKRRGLYIQLPARFSLHNIEDLPSIMGFRNIRCPVIYNFDKFYQCDGLFLCASQDESTLMLWNPYTGQTRLINTRDVLDGAYAYVIGYDNNNNHKVLGILYDSSEILKLEIYDFNSNSWRVLDITTDLYIYRGVSVKGNTYFVSKKRSYEEGLIICFDFTTERFGQRLPLPFPCDSEDDDVYPSCVREEQLAVLHQKRRITYELEIWITTKIESNAMSWSICFKVDMEPLAGSHFVSSFYGRSFFIDKEKKVVVVCGTFHEKKCSYRKSFTVGGDGNYKEIDLDNVFSYVPSLVFIQ